MSTQSYHADPDQRLEEALADYLRSVEAGQPCRLEALVAQYPDLAEELQEFFRNRTFMEQCTRPLRVDMPARIGDYQLLEFLGGGTFGDVFKARHVKLDSFVAIKLLRGEQWSSPEHVQSFWTEAQRMAKLNHDHIVPVYHFGEHEGRHYFVMKLIEGGSLAEHLQRCTPVERSSRRHQQWAAELMAHIARAVHDAHQRAILHRDLKPANILLDARGSPHITDFGLAKHLNDAEPAFELGSAEPEAAWREEPDRFVANTVRTQKGVIVGTAPYMSAEAAAGRELTTASDIYSLGVTLYEMITGQVPIRGSTTAETLKLIQQNRPPVPRTLNPRIDSRLEQICLKCLQRNPSDRYGSALGLANDLERWRKDEPLVSIPSRFAERGWLWCRRKPALAGLLAAAVLLSALVLVMAISVAQDRAARLEDEVLKSNVYAAQGVASTVLWHLERLSDPVIQTAEDPLVRQLLEKDDPASRAKLQQLFRDRFDPGGPLGLVNARLLQGRDEPSFQAMHATTTTGILVADTVDNPSVLGQDFTWRDYFQGAMAKKGSRGRAAIHVSRVYRSRNDGLWKFAISTPVYAGPEADAPILGVVAANFTTNSTLGLLRLNDERRTAVLVCPKDPTTEDAAIHFYTPKPGASLTNEYLVVVHPAYTRGDKAIPVVSPQLDAVHRSARGHEIALPDAAFDPASAMDRHYADPMAALDSSYAGRWLAGFAPVGNTEMVVIVQERYEDAIPSDHGIIWSGAAVLLAAIFMVAFGWPGFQWLAGPRE